MNNKPIFVLGAHKSGTSLVRSVFDGHSDLFVIPIETHFFQNKKSWVDNDYRWERPRKLQPKEIKKRFVNYMTKSNSVEDRYCDSVTRGIFNMERFNDYFSIKNIIDNDKRLIVKYFESIYYSVHGKKLSDNIRVVEKSVENAEFAQELNKFFPKSKFIHIIRNPYANLVSLRKFKSIKFGYPIIRRMIRTLYNNYYFLYKNMNLIDNYYIIKYENLVKRPKFSIKEMCNFLEIEFENILMTPTHLGKPWGGNSMTDKKFNSISPERLKKWKNEIHPMEIKYINHLFPFIFEDYNYTKIKPNGSFWRPVKGENLKRYLANRIYKFYLIGD